MLPLRVALRPPIEAVSVPSIDVRLWPKPRHAERELPAQHRRCKDIGGVEEHHVDAGVRVAFRLTFKVGLNRPTVNWRDAATSPPPLTWV